MYVISKYKQNLLRTEKLLIDNFQKSIMVVKKEVFSEVKLLVVDLDNTLCDTYHTLSKVQWVHAAKILEQHGIPKKKGEQMLRMLGKHSFRSTIQKLGLDERLQKVAIAAYDDVDVSNLKLFDDANAILECNMPKVLVTRGEEKLQRAKIKHLGIARKFKKIYYVKTFEDKASKFKLVQKDFKLRPKEMLVIGDRIEEEIKDANMLGMKTAFVDRPDWPSHPSVSKPDISVKNLWRLNELLNKQDTQNKIQFVSSKLGLKPIKRRSKLGKLRIKPILVTTP